MATRWLYYLVTAAFLPATTAAANDACTTSFILTDMISKHYDPIRISPGLVCVPEQAGGNGSCPLQSWAYLSYGPRLNVTFSSDQQKDALIDALPDEGGVIPFVKWQWVIHGIVRNETWQVPEGRAAYVQFEEAYDCAVTMLSGCQGSLADFEGEYVESCIPMYNTGSGSIPMFYDKSSLVFVDAETARGMTDHPYGRNETRTNDTQSVGNESEAQGNDTGAVEQQEGNGASVVGSSSLALAVFGLAAILELL